MNTISNVPENARDEATQRLRQLSAQGKNPQTAQADRAQTEDRADTSSLSKLMSEASRDLADEMQVRPQIVESFRAKRDIVELSNRAIASIFKKMVNS